MRQISWRYQVLICPVWTAPCPVCFHSQLSVQRHRWPPHCWVWLLVAGLSQLRCAAAQCFGGVETYEKTSGTTVLCDSGCSSQVLHWHCTTVLYCGVQGLLSQPDTSVTRDCIAICKQTSACNSFTVGKTVTESQL